MGSPLLSNDRVTFVVSKPFTSGEKEYAVGDDFPQEDARNIEVLVRARYVIPVVEDLADRPKYWYKEVRLKSDVLSRLFRDRVQLQMPEGQEPDSDEVVNLEVLTDPSKTPEPEGEGEDVFAEEETTEPGDEESEPEGEEPVPEGTITEIKLWVGDDPDRAARALEAEQAGQGRTTLIAWLEERVEP